MHRSVPAVCVCRGQRSDLEVIPQTLFTLVLGIASLTGSGLDTRLGWLASKAQESASLHLPRCHDLHGCQIDLTVFQ